MNVLTVLAALFVVLWGTFILGFESGASHEREEAIKAEAGCWIVNSKTGHKSFEYGAARGVMTRRFVK